MRPLLFQGTFFETPTYFALYLLAFLGAILLAARRAPALGLSPVRAVDLGMVSFVSGFIGARVFHVLIEAPEYYLRHPERVFYFWQGGFVLYGGLIAGILVGFYFLKYLKEPIGRWADLGAPAILLGIGIGRVGCLATGCCHGTPTEAWWGMIFTNPQSSAPLGVALHPTQALESLYCFAAAVGLHYATRKPLAVPGLGLVWAGIIYGLFRFGIEFLRGDLERGFFLGGSVSTSQLISLVVVVSAIIWGLTLSRRARNMV